MLFTQSIYQTRPSTLVIVHTSDSLETQDQFIRPWTGHKSISLLDARGIDDVSGVVCVDGCNDEFHFCSRDMLQFNQDRRKVDGIFPRV